MPGYFFGGVPEWPKGSDCKSDAQASVVRIHPPPPDLRQGFQGQAKPLNGLQAPGLPGWANVRVWFNGRTSAFQADGAGSIPATRSN